MDIGQLLKDAAQKAQGHVSEVYDTLNNGSTGRNIRHDRDAILKTLVNSFPAFGKEPQQASIDDLLAFGGVGAGTLDNKLYRGLSKPFDANVKNNIDWYSTNPELAKIYGEHQITKDIPENLKPVDLGFRDYMTEVKKDDVLGRVKDRVLDQFRNKNIDSDFAKKLISKIDSLKGGNEFKRAHEWINTPDITQILSDSGYNAISHIENGSQTYGLLNKLVSSKFPPTQFSLAHEIAQKNAALPIEKGGLGLHPDNTAMERAKALGFDKDVYHGTNANIEKFDPKMSAQGGITWVADSPDFTEEFIRSTGGGNILPLKARMGNAAGWKEYDNLGIDELSGRGYESTWLPDSTGGSGFVMKPNQLRSKFAAFDPMKKDSANILASLLAGLGIASNDSPSNQ